MRILLNNAYESWMDATAYAELIKDGVSTLGYKKKFVSSLHNAVELFIKQILLDNRDYRIATVKRVDKDGQPLKKMYESTDLNQFFQTLLPDERKLFYTIEFSEIIQLLKSQKYLTNDYSEPLNVLNTLRNNETHFYIKNDDYLKDSEFKMLYNFMVDFFGELMSIGLIPRYVGLDEGELTELWFSGEKIKNYTYSSAIKRSSVTKRISKALKNVKLYHPETESVFLFMQSVWDYIEDEMYSYEKTWAYVESLFNVGAVKFVEVKQKEYIEYESQLEDGTPFGDRGLIEHPYYQIRIKTLK